MDRRGGIRRIGRHPRGSGRYARGWFREPGQIPMYVSRGIGTSMVPVRLGSVPEVAVFTMAV